MLTIIRGLPGSGKTTLAQSLLDATWEQKRLHIEADMYFTECGKYNWNPELIPEAHRWCQKTTKIYLKNNWSVIVSNTFTTIREMQFYIDLAKTLRISYKVYRCVSQWKSDHNVPEDVIVKMKNRFQAHDGEIFIS